MCRGSRTCVLNAVSIGYPSAKSTYILGSHLIFLLPVIEMGRWRLEDGRVRELDHIPQA